MKRYIFIIFLVFSSSTSLADENTNYYSNVQASQACDLSFANAPYTGSQGCVRIGQYFQYAVYSWPDLENSGTFKASQCPPDSACNVNTFTITNCPDHDPSNGQCIEITPPGGDDVVTAGTKPGNPADDLIVDQDGNVWEQTSETVDPYSGKAVGQWSPTGQTVDPSDESTWPEGSTSSGDGLFAPTALDEDGFPIEGGDAFTNGIDNPSYSGGGLDIPTTVTDFDTSTTTDQNSTTTQETTTKVLPDGDIERKTVITTNNNDGTSTEKTTTVTRSSTTGTTTTTVLETATDSGGNTTTTLSGTQTNEGDDTETSSASASSNCNSPPPCTGDPIGCALLIEEWKNSCNAYESVTASTDCSSRPTCDGDPIECALLIQQFDQYCSTQEGINNLASDAQDHFTNQGMTDLDSLGEGDLFNDLLGNDGEVDVQTELGDFYDFSPTNGTCPSPQSVSLGQFGSYDFSYQFLCDFASLLRYVVLLGAYFLGGNIVLRSFTS